MKVLGKECKIIWYDEHPVHGEDILVHGKHDWTTGTIHIRKCLDYDRTMDTLIHEVIHAIAAEIDIKIEERDIVGLASGLQCFLKDNFLVRWRGSK